MDSFYEALKTKQDDFANRPVLKSFDYICHGAGVAMNNGPRWRMIRTAMQQKVTNKQKGVEAEDMIVEEVSSSLKWLLDERVKVGRGKDFDFRQLCRRESLNIAMRNCFSFRFGEEKSPQYWEVQDWIRIIFEYIAQGSPSDFMPIFKYFPNPEIIKARKAIDKMEAFIDAELQKHKTALGTKQEKDYDFIDHMLQHQIEAKKSGSDTLTDLDIRVCTWDIMAGQIDTSATTMEWMIYILINHKSVLKKVQRLLDEVVGPDRLPNLNDIPKLEYLTAIIDEVFRWKHFAPQGLPHEAAKDTTILGYNVPKGTQVFLNYHSLHMNPKYWKKPEEFRPERFLEEERALLETCLHPEKFFPSKESYKFVPFGQGRRRCVGYGIGRIVMWLKAAMWLHCFEWESADGKPLDITTEYLGITLVPEEQKVKAIPRPAARLLRFIDPNKIETR
uniref:Cytochrome P450 n=1 Tax=Aplanochytrium stocchinoi TaxID=215587 RepID=A0A6S8D9R5_9STRA